MAGVLKWNGPKFDPTSFIMAMVYDLVSWSPTLWELLGTLVATNNEDALEALQTTLPAKIAAALKLKPSLVQAVWTKENSLLTVDDARKILIVVTRLVNWPK